MKKILLTKKGDLFSGLIYFYVTVGFIAIALIILFVSSIAQEDANAQEISEIKSGYQTIQIARTFTQTPMEFEGETMTIAQWVNYYFLLEDVKTRSKLRLEFSNMGKFILTPYMARNFEGTSAVFSYYTSGVLKDSVMVANSNLNIVKTESSIITGAEESADIVIQLPVYEKGNENSNSYILFTIEFLSKDTSTVGMGSKI